MNADELTPIAQTTPHDPSLLAATAKNIHTLGLRLMPVGAFLSVVAGVVAFAAVSAWAQPSTTAPLRLTAETSKFQRTGNYAEVETVCQTLANNYPNAVRCFSTGRSAEGRPMWVMAVSRSGALTPTQAKRLGVPVVLAIAGTHAGEIDGKDAGLMLIRDWLQKPPTNDPLRQQVFCLYRFSMWMGTSAPARITAPIKTVQVCKANASPHSASI